MVSLLDVEREWKNSHNWQSLQWSKIFTIHLCIYHIHDFKVRRENSDGLEANSNCDKKTNTSSGRTTSLFFINAMKSVNDKVSF